MLHARMAQIRTETSVQTLNIKNGRAQSVVLENGDELTAKVICSSLDPHRTFLKLVGEDNLDPEFTQQIKRFKMRGSSGKVNLALDKMPDFACRPGTSHLRGDIAIAPSIEYLDKAYEDAKYGDFSERPYLNVVFPTMFDRRWRPPVNTLPLFLCSTRRIKSRRAPSTSHNAVKHLETLSLIL